MVDVEAEGPKLPLELLDTILDELATNLVDDPDSHTALLECSLVCRSFHSRASGHIFANISIASKGGGNVDVNNLLAKKLQDLYEILERNKSLALRVKTLGLETCYADTIMAYNPESFLENPHLPLILDRFSSIAKFQWVNHIQPFPWEVFSEPIHKALRTLIERPSLTSLSFSSIENVPVDLVISNCNLIHLMLTHIDIYEQTDDHPPLPSTTSRNTLRLKSHVNHNSAGIVFQLLSKSPLIFSEMSSLRIWMRKSDEVNTAWVIMQLASETLETLDIEDVSHFRYPTMIPGPVDIGVLQNLRHFKVNCRIASGDGIVFPMGIYGLLNPGTPPSSLENVEITIDWIDCLIGTESRRFVEEPGWVLLDEVLSGSKFPALRSVLLTLKMGYGWKTIQSSGDNPPQRVVALKDRIQSLVARLLPQTSRSPTKKVNINLLIYKSRYALDID